MIFIDKENKETKNSEQGLKFICRQNINTLIHRYIKGKKARRLKVENDIHRRKIRKYGVKIILQFSDHGFLLLLIGPLNSFAQSGKSYYHY